VAPRPVEHRANGRQNYPTSCSYWFFAIESFVNSIWRAVSEIDSKCDFRLVRKKDLTTRLTELISLLGADLEAFYKSGIFARFGELIQFRNDIFHDRQHGVLIEYKKTAFSKVPPLLNQVDVLQSMVIAIEVFNYLRYAFPNIDIMPEVVYFPKGTIAYRKVDFMYESIVETAFTEILKKHGLVTDLVLSCAKELTAKASYFNKYDIAFMISADKRLEYAFNHQRSQIVDGYCHKVAELEDLDPGMFRVPSYGRKIEDAT